MEYEYIQCEQEDEKPEQVGPVYFIFQHVYWSGLLYYFFMGRLFGRLRFPGAGEPLSVSVSQWILLALVIVCITAGALFT